MLNAVEGFFAKLTRRRLKRDVFHSIVGLQARYQPLHRRAQYQPKPFAWKADPDKIIAARKRGFQRWNQSTRPLVSRGVARYCQCRRYTVSLETSGADKTRISGDEPELYLLKSLALAAG